MFVIHSYVSMKEKVLPDSRKYLEVVLASVYPPRDENPISTGRTKQSDVKNIPIIVGCDANAHHLVWGHTDKNSKEEELLEYLITTVFNIVKVLNAFRDASMEEDRRY